MVRYGISVVVVASFQIIWLLLHLTACCAAVTNNLRGLSLFDRNREYENSFRQPKLPVWIEKLDDYINNSGWSAEFITLNPTAPERERGGSLGLNDNTNNQKHYYTLTSMADDDHQLRKNTKTLRPNDVDSSSFPSTAYPTSVVSNIYSSSSELESSNDTSSVADLSEPRLEDEQTPLHRLALRPLSIVFAMSQAQIIPTESDCDKLIFSTSGYINKIFQVNDNSFRGAQMNATNVTFLASIRSSVYFLSFQSLVDLFWLPSSNGLSEAVAFSAFRDALEKQEYLETIVWKHSAFQMVMRVTLLDAEMIPLSNDVTFIDENQRNGTNSPFSRADNEKSQLFANNSQTESYSQTKMNETESNTLPDSQVEAESYEQQQASLLNTTDGNTDDKSHGSSKETGPIPVLPGFKLIMDYLFDAEQQILHQDRPGRLPPSEIICGDSTIRGDKSRFFDGRYVYEPEKLGQRGKSSKSSSKRKGKSGKGKSHENQPNLWQGKYYGGIFGSKGFDCNDLNTVTTPSPTVNTPEPTSPPIIPPTRTPSSPEPSASVQTTIPTLLPTKKPTTIPSWSPTMSLSPSIADTDTPTTSQFPSISSQPSISAQPSISLAPSISFAPSVSLEPTPRGPTIAPTLRDTSPSAAPSIPIITIDIPIFSISYVSPGATESPTNDEFELLWNATLEYLDKTLIALYADQTSVEFLGLSGELNDAQFEAGIPEPRYNLYIDSQISVFYSKDSNPPNVSEHISLFTDLINANYILDCVRNLPVPQFQAVNEVYARVSTR